MKLPDFCGRINAKIHGNHYHWMICPECFANCFDRLLTQQKNKLHCFYDGRSNAVAVGTLFLLGGTFFPILLVGPEMKRWVKPIPIYRIMERWPAVLLFLVSGDSAVFVDFCISPFMLENPKTASGFGVSFCVWGG